MSTNIIPMNDLSAMAGAIARSGLFGIKTPDQAQRLITRLYGNSVVSGECWIFQGSCMNSGYGRLRIGKTKDFSAHRISFAITKGAIPEGMCVLHTCDVRLCVNPAHLFLGTKRDNTQDMIAKGKHFSLGRTKTACPRGHPYSGVNSKGSRICAICQRKATLAHYYRSRQHV